MDHSNNGSRRLYFLIALEFTLNILLLSLAHTYSLVLHICVSYEEFCLFHPCQRNERTADGTNNNKEKIKFKRFTESGVESFDLHIFSLQSQYTFKYVFDEYASQKTVFDQMALPCVEDVLKGRNCKSKYCMVF